MSEKPNKWDGGKAEGDAIIAAMERAINNSGNEEAIRKLKELKNKQPEKGQEFTDSYERSEKALSSIQETTGGALVAPAKQKRVKESLFFNQTKSLPKPTIKESYFATCERDEGGHCLPSGEADHSGGPDSPKVEELSADAAADYAKNGVDFSKATNQNPADLLPTEPGEREDMDDIATYFPEGEEYLTVVAYVNSEGEKFIIDGHHRVKLADSRGDEIATVFLRETEMKHLEEEGFDRMEIAYAALQVASEGDAADSLVSQFSGSNLRRKGDEAAEILEDMRSNSSRKDDATPKT